MCAGRGRKIPALGPKGGGKSALTTVVCNV